MSFYGPEDIDRLDKRVENLENAIDRTIIAGQQRGNNSGGGSRDVTEVDVVDAEKMVSNLLRNRREIDGSYGGGSVMGVTHCQ